MKQTSTLDGSHASSCDPPKSRTGYVAPRQRTRAMLNSIEHLPAAH